MPLSPTESMLRNRLPDDYQEAGLRLDKLAQSGMSWSGYERNCAFLNSGRGMFTNVSAVSGFDFDDDGRSLALTDWDHDGDLDVWVANRTGPRVRFLRNNSPNTNRFVTLRLIGRSSNRDAIGARIELTARSREGRRKFIKTVRAGEGFLGQSSKTVHFGLGDHEKIDEVLVRWPSGHVEVISGVNANQHFLMVEGSGQAQIRNRNGRNVRLVSKSFGHPQANGPIHALLPVRVPLPELNYTTVDGKNASIADRLGQPILLNLWASWCGPCVSELAEFTRRRDELSNGGIQVIALSVDAITDSSEPINVKLFAESMNFPFVVGSASSSLVEKLQVVHDSLFKPHQPLPLPTSVLIDSQGNLSAIYKGALNLTQFQQDVGTLSQQGTSLVDTAIPFRGRWFGEPRKFRLLPLAAKLIEEGFLHDTMSFVNQHREVLSRDPGFSHLLLRMGTKLLSLDKTDDAVAYFEDALQVEPKNADAYYNLGIALLAKRQQNRAIDSFRRAIDLNPNHAKAINNLANIYVSQNQTDTALQIYQQALKANPRMADIHFNLGNLYLSRSDWASARKHFELAVEINPQHARAYNNLGIIASRNDMDDAIKNYRRATLLDSHYAQAHNNLATALASKGEANLAIEHYRKAVKIQPDLVDAQSNLGRILVSKKEYSDALKHLRCAAELKPQDPKHVSTLAWLLATNPIGDLRDPVEAIRLARHATERTEAKNPGTLDTLAAAYAANGQFDLAIETAQRAVDILDRVQQSKKAAPIERRIQLYRKNIPYRIHEK